MFLSFLFPKHIFLCKINYNLFVFFAQITSRSLYLAIYLYLGIYFRVAEHNVYMYQYIKKNTRILKRFEVTYISLFCHLPASWDLFCFVFAIHLACPSRWTCSFCWTSYEFSSPNWKWRIMQSLVCIWKLSEQPSFWFHCWASSTFSSHTNLGDACLLKSTTTSCIS